MRPSWKLLTAAVLGLAPLRAGADEILNLGDPAPPLKVSEWVKGDKVDGFDAGKTYVVEFWATWCGPCRASIPHLTELAHKYKDKGVRFIGVDVWENDTEKVAPFLEEMGDKMDYSVALDSVPKDGEPNDGAMAKGWMKAAEENGIPTAFIVRDGKIAWIGHPMSMDEPLAKITDGDWDATAKAAERLKGKLVERKSTAVNEKVFPLYRNHEYKKVVAAIDEATSGDPELAANFAWLKFVALCNGGDADKGLEVGEKLYDDNQDKAGALNNYFYQVISPEQKGEVDPRVAKLALKAAKRAVELTKEKNFMFLDTLAEAQCKTGDAKAAVETQDKAIKLAEAESEGEDDRMLKQLRDSRERFAKAAAEKKDGP